jgi:hypothetical protein
MCQVEAECATVAYEQTSVWINRAECKFATCASSTVIMRVLWSVRRESLYNCFILVMVIVSRIEPSGE